ncbi:S-layer family protein [Salsuginibacillus halophilus]|uniref:S-layer family protein n=1 Tax=Salsuginibacillus halophilus TaxID=517424 RepID=A0A2P8HQU6_9BACI|nr:S-layer homology domain-containing protein [Salsuginibacillus halophilus]PSL48591.1 S-layer family protein [Salsuginibacillus halophilus]
MKKAWIGGSAVVALTAALTTTSASATTFTDIEDHWAADQIMEMSEAGYIQGYADQTFRPNAEISRAEASAMLSRAFELEGDIEAGSAFSDIDSEHPLIHYISAAVENEILRGYADNRFQPNAEITRAETAVMLERIAGFDPEETRSFPDTNSHWAVSSIENLAGNNIINGYSNNYYGPDDAVSRAEFSNMLSSTLHYLEHQLENISYEDLQTVVTEEHNQVIEVDPFIDSVVVEHNDVRISGDSVQNVEVFDDVTNLYFNDVIVEEPVHFHGSTITMDHNTRIQEIVYYNDLGVYLGPNTLDKEMFTFTPGSDSASLYFYEDDSLSDLEPPVYSISHHHIELGDPARTLTATHGEPERISPSRQGFDWHTYHDEYEDFESFAVYDDEVVGFLTFHQSFDNPEGLEMGTTQEETEEAMDEMQDLALFSPGYDTLSEEDEALVEMHVRARDFGPPTPEQDETLEKAIANQMFDYINAERVHEGVEPLEWSDEIADVSREHSDDMAVNNYINRENQDGVSLADRFNDADISEYNYADASVRGGFGFGRTIHRGLMNRNFDRDTFLDEDVDAIGIGVALHDDNHRYTHTFGSE